MPLLMGYDALAPCLGGVLYRQACEIVSNRLYLTTFPIQSQQTQLAPSITPTNHCTAEFLPSTYLAVFYKYILNLVTSPLPPTLCNSEGPSAAASAGHR